MQLTLTFMICKELVQTDVVEKIDVMVNSQQKILDTIRILQEAGTLPGIEKHPVKVRSVRKKYMIETEQTYEQEKIFYGDILEIV